MEGKERKWWREFCEGMERREKRRKEGNFVRGWRDEGEI